jgi:hypothetical protein
VIAGASNHINNDDGTRGSLSDRARSTADAKSPWSKERRAEQELATDEY